MKKEADLIRTAESKFWDRVEKSSGCWIWTGGRCKNRGGYGRFKVGRKIMRAHRVSWVLNNGPILDDLYVLHRCDNPPCVKPDHLFLGTALDNINDSIKKGRRNKNTYHRGEAHHAAKLKEWQVNEIRSLRNEGTPLKDIAKRHGTSYKHISEICTGRTWSSLIRNHPGKEES